LTEDLFEGWEETELESPDEVHYELVISDGQFHILKLDGDVLKKYKSAVDFEGHFKDDVLNELFDMSIDSSMDFTIGIVPDKTTIDNFEKMLTYLKGEYLKHFKKGAKKNPPYNYAINVPDLTMLQGVDKTVVEMMLAPVISRKIQMNLSGNRPDEFGVVIEADDQRSTAMIDIIRFKFPSFRFYKRGPMDGWKRIPQKEKVYYNPPEVTELTENLSEHIGACADKDGVVKKLYKQGDKYFVENPRPTRDLKEMLGKVRGGKTVIIHPESKAEYKKFIAELKKDGYEYIILNKDVKVNFMPGTGLAIAASFIPLLTLALPAILVIGGGYLLYRQGKKAGKKDLEAEPIVPPPIA